jgi:hypothetical protein
MTQSKGTSDKVSSPLLTGSVSSRSERATIPGPGPAQAEACAEYRRILAKKLSWRNVARPHELRVELRATPSRDNLSDRSDCMIDLLVKLPLMVDAWGDMFKLLRALFKLFGW